MLISHCRCLRTKLCLSGSLPHYDQLVMMYKGKISGGDEKLGLKAYAAGSCDIESWGTLKRYGLSLHLHPNLKSIEQLGND